jgi:hypothetical protein
MDGERTMNKINQLSSQQLITAIFEPVKQLNKAMPERITQYILYGEDPNVLVDLNQLSQSSNSTKNLYELLRRPCDLYIISLDDKANSSEDARIAFYQRWTDEYSNEQITRFARVLASVCSNLHFIKLITSQVPSWFLYLLYDGLITTMTDCINEDQRQNWSIKQLHQLLDAQEPELSQKLLMAIFDRQNISINYQSYFRNFFIINDLLPYIIEHIEIFKQLPEQGIAVLGQVEQLKYIQQHPELHTMMIDFIAVQSLNSSKQVSQLATEMLLSSPREIVQPHLQRLLTSGTVKQRSSAATLQARMSSDPTILQQALASETNKTVITAIESALSRLESANAVEQQATLVIADFEPIQDIDLPINARDILQQNYEEYLIECEKAAQKEAEYNKKYLTNWTTEAETYKALKVVTSKDLDDIYHYLNGKIELSALFKKTDNSFSTSFVLAKNRLQNLPECTLFHFLRAARLADKYSGIYYFQQLYEKNEFLKDFDLRQIAYVLAKLDDPERSLYAIALPFLTTDTYHEFYENEPNKLWPFFAEHEFLLDEALGFAPANKIWSYINIDKASAIKILQTFPTLPAKYVSYLCELALEESKQIRYTAQDALSVIPNIHNQVEQALSSAKQEVRIAAANWLAQLGQKSSIKALNEALQKEKRETVQASLLIALEKIGEDISQQLTTKKLLADAQKGLKGKKPTDFDWFDVTLIPSLTWQNGEDVDPQIVQWWVWLAVKLKEPANPLLGIYSRLLSLSSQQLLGEFILQSFIKQDTRRPTVEEAEAQANLLADKRLQQCIKWYQQYPQYYPSYANITFEQIFEEIKNETLAVYLGSAIKAKGLLALTRGIEGRVAVSLVRNYMKDHQQRRAQIEAMLEPLANSDDPLITQLLLSLARRYRTASIQEKARLLVENIAKRNGWATDELADRTISTAGLDDNGVLTLDYGERIFTASFDDKFKWHLKNSDGDEIKALPEARKSEDVTLVKEAKKQFTNSKKELTQLLNMQMTRFYEAMCAQRHWRVEDWQKYLQPHPIVGRLVQRLIWLELDDKGQIVNSFRPTEDGSLITTDDDEISLNQVNKIAVAHSALLSSDNIKAWQHHLKDYKVTQLFEQFTHSLPDVSKVENNIINECFGWLTDSFTLRGILTKLGYKRDAVEDAGCFYGYYKYFVGLNLYINIEFSGSMVPEENVPVALFNLYFSKKPGLKHRAIELNQVPPVLLAEGYADYMAVAKASSGFDPKWEQKLLW